MCISAGIACWSSQVGVAGSSVIEDFAVLGGQVGVADHVHIGAGARLAARAAMVSGQSIAGGQDYGGVPAKPVREWLREIHALSGLAHASRLAAASRTTMTDTATKSGSHPGCRADQEIAAASRPVPVRGAADRYRARAKRHGLESGLDQRAAFPGPFSRLCRDAGRADRGSDGADGGRAGGAFSLGFAREKRIVYFMTIEKARFRKPVTPGDMLRMPVKAHPPARPGLALRGPGLCRRYAVRRSRVQRHDP